MFSIRKIVNVFHVGYRLSALETERRKKEKKKEKKKRKKEKKKEKEKREEKLLDKFLLDRSTSYP